MRLLVQIFAATSMAASRSSSRGTTAVTEPQPASTSAVTGSAVYTISRIRCWGTRRARCVAAPSAPWFTSGRPNVVPSAATITSELPTNPIPPPRQKSCTAQITGTSHSYTALNAA